MSKKIILLMLVLLAACSEIPKDTPTAQQTPAPKKELKVDIPNASWVKIYFEGIDENDSRGIDKVATRGGLSKLRETVLPENDLELRVWVGFGLYGIDGFILKRSLGSWSATGLKQMLCHLENRAKVELKSPKSGWETAWQKLVDAGILTLPDSSELKSKSAVTDGKSYVVEINSEYVYRTYEYSNPNFEELKEAKQIIKIGEIIADEFGLESFSIKTGGCGKNE